MAEVSRQFSDAERALDERVQEFIFAPKYTPSGTADTAVAYNAVREDLKHQTAVSKDLMAQQEVAFSASARKQLHGMAVANDLSAKDAQRALEEVPGLLNQGMTTKEIKTHLLKDNPQRLTNKYLVDGLKAIDEHVEDDDQNLINEAENLFKRLDFTEKGKMSRTKIIEHDVKLEDIPAYEQAIRVMEEKGRLLASKEVVQGKIDLLKANASYQRTVASGGLQAAWTKSSSQTAAGSGSDTVSGVPGPGPHLDQNTQGRIALNLERMGLRVNDLNTLAGYITSGHQAGFLEDAASIDELARMRKVGRSDILNELSVLGSKAHWEAFERGDGSPEAEAVQSALSTLRIGGGIFSQIHAGRIEDTKATDAVKEIEMASAKGLRAGVQKHREALPAAFDDVELNLYTGKGGDKAQADPVFGNDKHDKRTANMAGDAAKDYVAALYKLADPEDGAAKYDKYVKSGEFTPGWDDSNEGETRDKYMGDIRKWMMEAFTDIQTNISGSPAGSSIGGTPTGATVPAPTSPSAASGGTPTGEGGGNPRGSTPPSAIQPLGPPQGAVVNRDPATQDSLNSVMNLGATPEIETE